LEGQLDWFLWESQGESQDYVAQVPDEQGILRSQTFPGLWLALPALLAGELGQVLSVLQEGLKTPEHTTWVEELKLQGLRPTNATSQPSPI
jgi:hypothetical protein